MDSKITRRELLVTTGSVALVGLVAAETAAAGAAPGAGAAAGNAAGAVPAAAEWPVAAAAGLDERGPLRVLDGLLAAEELEVGRRELAPFRPGVLKLDLVRQWRDELHSRVARGDQLIAVTRWDKALLFNELARESRFAIRQERIAGTLFRTDISREAAT